MVQCRTTGFALGRPTCMPIFIEM